MMAMKMYTRDKINSKQNQTWKVSVDVNYLTTEVYKDFIMISNFQIVDKILQVILHGKSLKRT